MLQFQRITTQKRFIPQIDGLRFVAIGAVVLFHIYAALERGALPLPVEFNTDLAKRGVELFFGISGFILGVPFASHHLMHAPKVKLRQYFLRRLTRLEPPYFLSLFAWAAMQWITAHRSLSDMAPHLLASFVYMHNLIFGGFPGAVNSVAWSLEVEVQFYVLVPLLSLLFAIGDARIRRGVILLVMAVAGVLSNPLYRSLHFHYSIAYYLAFFLAGFLVCDLYLSYKNQTSNGQTGKDSTYKKDGKISFLWDALALCLWPLVWYMNRDIGHIVLPFVIVVLYLAAFRGRVCSAVFSNRVITDIGGMCYSIYLFHFLVIYGVKHITAYWHIGNNFWLYYAMQLCLIVPPVLFFCGAFFLLIERPCMDREWPKKLWRQWQATMLSTRPSQS
jgi:peptidoglycan/LPS O-acetylase OafA/YrhL